MWLETSSGAEWEKKSFSPRAERIGLWWGPRQFKQGNQSLGNTATTSVVLSRPSDLQLKPVWPQIGWLKPGIPSWAMCRFLSFCILGNLENIMPCYSEAYYLFTYFGLMFLENILIFSKTQSWRSKDLSRGRASWSRSENEGGWFTHSVNAAIKCSNTIIHILRLMDQKAGWPSFTFLIQNISLDPVLLASYIIMYFRTVTGQLFYHRLLGLKQTLSGAQ